MVFDAVAHHPPGPLAYVTSTPPAHSRHTSRASPYWSHAPLTGRAAHTGAGCRVQVQVQVRERGQRGRGGARTPGISAALVVRRRVRVSRAARGARATGRNTATRPARTHTHTHLINRQMRLRSRGVPRARLGPRHEANPSAVTLALCPGSSHSTSHAGEPEGYIYRRGRYVADDAFRVFVFTRTPFRRRAHHLLRAHPHTPPARGRTPCFSA